MRTTWTSMLAMVVGAVLSAGTPASAQDAAAPAAEPAPAAAADGASTASPTAADGLPELSPLRVRKHALTNENRWENGLEAKLTTLFTRKASDITSPTTMLSAQWNYRLPSDSYIGLAASGMPTNNQDTDKNGIQRSFSVYYGGLNLAQGVHVTESLRGAVTVSAGRGIAYVRSSPPVTAANPNATPYIGSAQFNYIEPGFFTTFLQYSGLDIGAVITYRMALVVGKGSPADNSDLSSISLGVTFRTLSR